MGKRVVIVNQAASKIQIKNRMEIWEQVMFVRLEQELVEWKERNLISREEIEYEARRNLAR